MNAGRPDSPIGRALQHDNPNSANRLDLSALFGAFPVAVQAGRAGCHSSVPALLRPGLSRTAAGRTPPRTATPEMEADPGTVRLGSCDTYSRVISLTY